MIKEIRLTNFLSFRSEVVSFDEDITLLVGINGSGKSNLLKCIKMLRDGVSGLGLRKVILDEFGGFDNLLFKGNSEPASTIQVEFTFDGAALGSFGFNFLEDIRYSIGILRQPNASNYYLTEKLSSVSGFVYLDFANGSGTLTEVDSKASPNAEIPRMVKYDHFADEGDLALSKVFDTERYFPAATVRKAIEEIAIYDYFDTTSKSAIRKPMLPTSEKRLLPYGVNLPQILNTLKINSKDVYAKIVELLRAVNPFFSGFDFNFIGGNIELMLEERQLGSSIHVSAISDGTLRYLCLLSILMNPRRGSFVCIDEPEVGLHPDMIATIGRLMAEMTGSSSLLITTHSENLLNTIRLKNLRVLEKGDDNSSKIMAFDEDDFKGWYAQFSVGNMWRQGDLGGNRW